MMGGGLERGAGCLFNRDPGKNAPLRCMQGIFTEHTYHLTIAFSESIELCVRHCSVNYAAGTIIKRCNFIAMILCATLRYCQRTKS